MRPYNEEEDIEQPEKVEDIMHRLNSRKGDKFIDICPPKPRDKEISHECIELVMTLEAIRERKLDNYYGLQNN
jgi:hypothetical protein